MDKEIRYNSQKYDAVKAFLYAVPTLIALVSIVIITARYIHSEAFVVIGWVLVCSVPFLFQKAYKQMFSRRVELEFNNQNFTVKEYKIKDDILVKEFTITWAEIHSYKCSFSSQVTYITVRLHNGLKYGMSFKEEKTQEQVINEKSVFSIFYYYISQYNSNKQQEDKIVLQPGFLTTNSGALLLYSLTAVAIGEIIIHIVFAPSSFMLSFMSFFIIIGLLLKRKTDKDLYNKMVQLEPRTPID